MADHSHDRAQGDVGPAPPAGDTIAAVATAPGYGGVGIVRVSGPATRAIAARLLGRLPRPRHATTAAFKDASGAVLDRGIALFFPAPHSFTGEDVLELQGHGGPVVLDLVLASALAAGARPAQAGEFSERAFLNGKLDLAQAEAVADLIASGSEAAARSAMRSLEGAFSRRVDALLEQLIALRTYVEAAIDFPDEELDLLQDSQVVERLDALLGAAQTLLASTEQGRLLHDGMHLVLAGAPNVGKSSLLNALAQAETAIVSPVPGTTRDVVHERIHIDGMPVHVFDTAGLRESADALEAEGMRRARSAMERGDHVLLLIDDTHDTAAHIHALVHQLPPGVRHTIVRNKIDLTGRAPALIDEDNAPCIALSAKTGAGIELLRTHLKRAMRYEGGPGVFMARRRHVVAIEQTIAHLRAGRDQYARRRAPELLAEDLRLAQQTLGEITGRYTSEDLLGEIFASFCIGK